ANGKRATRLATRANADFQPDERAERLARSCKRRRRPTDSSLRKSPTSSGQVGGGPFFLPFLLPFRHLRLPPLAPPPLVAHWAFTWQQVHSAHFSPKMISDEPTATEADAGRRGAQLSKYSSTYMRSSVISPRAGCSDALPNRVTCLRAEKRQCAANATNAL
uniref:Uncharacterized protein n=1 Tax=Plectus sambesii TaxID=2011161 RepID=A0A914XG02_9BILA